MPSLPEQTKHKKSYSSKSNPIRQSGEIHTAPRVLLLTANLEIRQPLLRTLGKLSADTVTCSTRAQAEELLAQQEFELVFCDEHLSDGSYRDLIHLEHCAGKVPRIVVTTRTGEWDLYFKAMGNGAFDIARSPWHSTDIEMILIRALREHDQAASSAATA